MATVELTDETLDEVFTEYLIDQNLAGPDAVRVAWDMALPTFLFLKDSIWLPSD